MRPRMRDERAKILEAMDAINEADDEEAYVAAQVAQAVEVVEEQIKADEGD